MEILIALLSAPVLVVTAFLCLEMAVGLRRTAQRSLAIPLSRAVVVVPAHNEEGGIGETLVRLCAEAKGLADVLVVADNCTDATAQIARDCGVEVIERNDQSRRGKGYALGFAQAHLSADPPATVAVIDADCSIDRESLRLLISAAQQQRKPAQAVNLLRPGKHDPLVAVSNFAFMLKNLVRQRGLQRLAGSVHLTGTGMALPWALFDHDRLSNGSIVEDIKFGIELTNDGHGPQLVPGATVWSGPSSYDGTLVQRRRWEGGYIALAVSIAPRYLLDAVIDRDPRGLCRALDLCVPPIALLVLVNLALLAVTSAVTFGFSLIWWPVVLQLIASMAAAVLILIAWSREGRPFVSLPQLASMPIYVLRKIPLYLSMRHRGSAEWRSGR